MSEEQIFIRTAEFVTSQMGVAVISGAIVLWAIIAYVQFRRRIKPIIKTFKRHTRSLAATEGEEGFASALYDLRTEFEESPLLGHSWREFEETLIEPDIDAERQVIRCPFSAADFFSRNDLLGHAVNLRLYNALPNFLTGAGILGTFIGLVAGIALASHGLTSENMKDMKSALEGLLNGASLAFLTSIVGLVSSILFSAREKHWIHIFDGLRTRWVQGLDERLERVTPEGIALDALRESRQQTIALQQFSDQLAFQLVEALENSVVAPMQPFMERLVGAVEGLRTDQSRANDETLERLIQQFSSSISGAAGKEMEAFAETVREMGTTLKTQISTMASSQEAMQRSSQRTIEDLTNTFRESSRQLNEELSGSVKSMVDEISSTVSEMTAALKQSTETTTTNMNQIVERFDDSVAKLRRSISDIQQVTEGTSTVLGQIEALISAVRKTHDDLAATADPIAAAADHFSEAANLMGRNSESMERSTAALGDTIENMAGMQDELTRAWSDYNSRFASVDQSLKQVFEELDNGLRQYARATHDYMTELDEHTARVIGKLAGAVEQLEGSIEDLGDQLAERTA